MYESYTIMTDRPLEDIPGFRSETIDGRTMLIRGGIMFEPADESHYIRRHIWGPGEFDGRMNGLVGTEVAKWHMYYVIKRTLCESAVQLLFVYEYLEHGGHMIVYEQASRCMYHPETPVSSIDVAGKGPGRAPLDEANFHLDVMYHFYKSRPFAASHSTSLIDRIGQDEPWRGVAFRPRAPMTVRELQEIAGEGIGIISVHDYDTAMRVMEMNSDPDSDIVATSDFQPLEMVMDDETLRCCRDLWGPEDHMVHARSEYGDEEVLLYAPYLHMDRTMDRLGIGYYYASIPSDVIAVAALVRHSGSNADAPRISYHRKEFQSFRSLRLGDHRPVILSYTLEVERAQLGLSPTDSEELDYIVSLLIHGDPLPERYGECTLDDGSQGCFIAPRVMLKYRRGENGLDVRKIVWIEGGGPQIPSRRPGSQRPYDRGPGCGKHRRGCPRSQREAAFAPHLPGRECPHGLRALPQSRSHRGRMPYATVLRTPAFEMDQTGGFSPSIHHTIMSITGFDFITDRPLEEIPGFRSETDRRGQTWLRRGCLSFQTTDRAYCERRFTYGFDGMDGLFNHMVGTDRVGWSMYVTEEYSWQMYVSALLFVYEYLRYGDHVIMYVQQKGEPFHPETPVSSIDVSGKGPGRAPLDEPEWSCDILYHFHRSGPYAAEHDTFILDRMGADVEWRRTAFVPSAPLTVRELQDIAGSGIGILSVHDYDEAMSAIERSADPDVYKRTIQNIRPLELIMNEEALSFHLDHPNTQYIGEIHRESVYGDEEVLMYALYFEDSGVERRLGIYDGCPDSFHDGMMALAVLIRPSFQRPVSELREKDTLFAGTLGYDGIRTGGGRVRMLMRTHEFDMDCGLSDHVQIYREILHIASVLLRGDPLPERYAEQEIGDGMMRCGIADGVELAYSWDGDLLILHSVVWTDGGAPSVHERSPSAASEPFQLLLHDGDVADVYVPGALDVVEAPDPVHDQARPEELRVRDELLAGVEFELGVVAEGRLALHPVYLVPFVLHRIVQQAVGGLRELGAAEIVLGAVGDALPVQPFVEQPLSPQSPLPLPVVGGGRVDDVVPDGLAHLVGGLVVLQEVRVADVGPELLLARAVLLEYEHRHKERGEVVLPGELHYGRPSLPLLQHLLGCPFHDVEPLLHLARRLLGEEAVEHPRVVSVRQAFDVLRRAELAVERSVLLVPHLITADWSRGPRRRIARRP